MGKNERDILECLIDRYTLKQVLNEVAAICGEKAAHLAVNWQDTTAGKIWIRDAQRVEKCADSVSAS